MQTLLQFFDEYPWLGTGAALLLVLCLAWLVRVIGEAAFKRVFSMLLARTHREWDEALLKQGFFRRLAQILSPLTVQFALPFIPGLPEQGALVLRNLTSASAALFAALAVTALLNSVQSLYRSRSGNGSHSIKSYLQIAKLIVFAVTAISIVSTLIDKSPLILLSGLGAMSAVLLLVFRDTLLSFVASIQLSSNDMLRVGDWIEMAPVGADGAVVDIALHTVKVQNWDNTITTIPTWRLIGESFKNWRGMQESGGRRIKRSLRLDTHSVDFLSDEAIARLRKITLLQEYLQDKHAAVTETNAGLGDAAQLLANQRRLTNVGTFRAYALAYLQRHPDIHKEMTCMVRLLEPGSEGVPVEIYCFTNTTAWLIYERIQGDIFDHLLAILPEFGLRLFQNPSGADLRSLRLPE